MNGWVGDREAVGSLLVGERGRGGSGTERSSQMRDTFWCGILVLQDLLLPERPRYPLTFEVGWLCQPVAWILCLLQAAISAYQIVKVSPHIAPSPSPAGSSALLSPCLVPSSVLSVVDLWIFSP